MNFLMIIVGLVLLALSLLVALTSQSASISIALVAGGLVGWFGTAAFMKWWENR